MSGKTVDKKQIGNEKKEWRNKVYKIYALICTFANIDAIDSSGLKNQKKLPMPFQLHLCWKRLFQSSFGVWLEEERKCSATVVGKRRNEFAREWHVAWLAKGHNYAELNICRMTQRNQLRPFWRQFKRTDAV